MKVVASLRARIARLFVRDRQYFDAEGVRDALVQTGLLRKFPQEPTGQEPAILRHFTETDPRKYALWQISLFWQFQPAQLKTLTDDDLLYLAGQSAEGYPDGQVYGIDLNKNKVTQNALRARVELETRALSRAGVRTAIVSVASALLGALFTGLATVLLG